MYIPDLSNAFVTERFASENSYNTALQLYTVGNLFLPTGKIVAADPLVFPEQEPFTVTVKPGSYPVILSVAAIGTEKIVAYAMLQFGEISAVRWEMAVNSNQDVNQLGLNEIFGYGVDCATGGFMDAEVANFIANLGDEKGNKLYDELDQKMDKNAVPSWAYLNTILIPEIGANLIMFSSGWGDGEYASYFGYDEQNNLVHLITDFGVIDEEGKKMGV